MTLSLTSPAFPANGDIPRNTPATARISPLPSTGAGRLRARRALRSSLTIPTHPTPKRRTSWVRWVLNDIPASATALPKTAIAKGTSGRDARGYERLETHRVRRPCPPIGRHRYFHKLYALDAPLGDLGRPTKAALERAMQGHILAKAELVGTYQRGK